MAAAVVGEGVKGIGQMIASGMTHPFFHFRILPGSYKYPHRKKDYRTGKVKMGKREYVPDPRFPDGITLSIPTWFVASVGLLVVIQGVIGLKKLLSGESLSLKEEKTLDLFKWGGMFDYIDL